METKELIEKCKSNQKHYAKVLDGGHWSMVCDIISNAKNEGKKVYDWEIEEDGDIAVAVELTKDEVMVYEVRYENVPNQFGNFNIRYIEKYLMMV